MNLNKTSKRTSALCLLLIAFGFAAGCESDDSEKTECVPYCANESIAVICENGVETAVSCENDETCFDAQCYKLSTNSCSIPGSECLTTSSYRACVNGFWSYTKNCNASEVCSSGKCISSSETCLSGARKCTDDKTGYQLCAGTDVMGTWSQIFDCPKETICNESNGQCESVSDNCSATKPECTSDNRGYRVCVSGKWSEIIACTGTATCKDGQCSADDATSRLPCANVGEQKCISNKRVQICNKDNFWEFMDCPPDVPVCDRDRNECTPAQCSAGQTKCLDDNTIGTCVDNAWDYNDCPDETPLCKNNICQEAPKECTPGERQCVADDQARICNKKGQWETENCFGGFKCDQGYCSECETGKTMCGDDYHSIKTCKEGKWSTAASCPQSTPYCPLNTTDCIKISEGTSCSASFSFCYNSNLNYCESYSSKVLFHKCTNGCIQSKDGIGATCKEFEYECTSLGKTSYGDFGNYSENGSNYINKASCIQCKAMSDGSARWVPVDKSFCNY